MSFFFRTWASALFLLIPLTWAGAVETQLVVTATDDGMPTGSFLRYTWTAKVVPAAATGANAPQILFTPSTGIPTASTQNPRVVLTVAGDYTFNVEVSDGNLSTNADVKVTVANPVNTAPTISDILNQLIPKGGVMGPVNFTIGDGGTTTGLTISASSSNTDLVPNANIVLGGTGGSRTITVTPVSTLSSTTIITVTVRDSGGLTATDTFQLTVNAPPVITSVKALQATLTLP